MSFHISNLGYFGDEVRYYTDLNGMVPEAHDEADDLHWPSNFTWDGEDEWESFRTDAVTATIVASNALRDWQATR